MMRSCKGCGLSFVSDRPKVYCSKVCLTFSKKQKRKRDKIKELKEAKAAARKAAIDAIPPYRPVELVTPTYIRLTRGRYRRRDP